MFCTGTVEIAGVLLRNGSYCWCSAQERFILLVFCSGTVHIAGIVHRNRSDCWCSAQEWFRLLVFRPEQFRLLVAYTVNVQVTAGSSTYKQLRSLVFHTGIYHWCPKGEHSDHWSPTSEHSDHCCPTSEYLNHWCSTAEHLDHWCP